MTASRWELFSHPNVLHLINMFVLEDHLDNMQLDEIFDFAHHISEEDQLNRLLLPIDLLLPEYDTIPNCSLDNVVCLDLVQVEIALLLSVVEHAVGYLFGFGVGLRAEI